MDALYVSMTGDVFGEAALGQLERMGHRTRRLNQGETAPEGSVALFTPTGSLIVEPTSHLRGQIESLRRKPAGRGGYYLCCSAVNLAKVCPDWARPTPLWVGVKSVQDRRPKLGGTFVFALKELVRMYRRWNWNSARLAPWSNETAVTVRPKLAEWRQKPATQKVVRRAVADLNICQRVLKALEAEGGYYDGDPSRALQISPDHFPISPSELAFVEEAGPIVWDFLGQALKLYLEAIQPGSPLAWVAKSVEGPIETEQREWQRRIANAQPAILPLVTRPDPSSLTPAGWFIPELQVRIGGQGFVNSWLTAIRQVHGMDGIVGSRQSFAYELARVVQKVLPDGSVAALLVPRGREDEQTYFAQRLSEAGLLTFTVHLDHLEEGLRPEGNNLYLRENGARVGFINRRESNAASLARTPIGQAIIRASLEGNLVVEPPLNMLFDGKTSQAWPHHPQLRGWFSDAVRRIASPMALMPNGGDVPFWLDGRELTLQQIVGQPYVVKYGGENVVYGFGGRAVYRTDDNDEGVRLGIEQAQLGHPWVVQPLDPARYFVRQWHPAQGTIETHKAAGRLMFHYLKDPLSGKVEIVAACVHLRPNHWKAAGNQESIFQEIRVKRE